MSATYDSTLPTSRDFIRLLIGDTVPLTAVFQDEEIDVVLLEETAPAKAAKYFAAAKLLEILLARAAASSSARGLVSKTVGRLSKSWGIPGSSLQALEARIKNLRIQGATYSTAYPVMRMF